MKLSSNQLFVVALVALALLAGAAYLDRTYLPVLVGVLIGAIQLFAHINGAGSGASNVVQGVNLGVPLSATGPALESVASATPIGEPG